MVKHSVPIYRERHRKRTVNCMFLENRIIRVRLTACEFYEIYSANLDGFQEFDKMGIWCVGS